MAISDEHLKALGRIAVNFQALEQFIALLVGRMISDDQTVGRMVTTLLPFGKLCDLAGALQRHRRGNSSEQEEFMALLSMSRELEQERNAYFHSAWGNDSQSGDVVRIKSNVRSRKGMHHDMVDTDAAKLNDLADRMASTAKRILSYAPSAGANPVHD